MRLSEYVLSELHRAGVRTVFGVTGAAIADMIDSLRRVPGLRLVATQHEQAAAFAAEGLAKATGGLGAALATSGPGGINLLTGVANCWYDSTPALFVTGQVNSKFLVRDFVQRQRGFQENDIVDMARSITKFAYRVMDPRDIRWALARAVHEATTGRPGPVLLDIPLDVQRAEIEPDALDAYHAPDGNYTTRPLAEAARAFLADLARAERPVLLIGGGVRLAGAVDAVRELARVLGIPTLVTWNAVDVIASDHPHYAGRVGTYGGPGRNFALQNADLLLAIGCRFSGRITGGVADAFTRGAMRYAVDVDPVNLDPRLWDVPIDAPVCADARAFSAALLDAANGREWPDFAAWRARAREWRDRYDPATQVGANYRFIAAMAGQLTPRDVLVADCGGNAVVTYQALKTKTGQRVFSSHGNSPMGFALCGALGAACAPGVERVVCVIGDGGMQVNVQELQTLAHYGLPVKTFVMNNHGYGIIRAYQATNCGGRYTASGPDGYSVPDIGAIARAYGLTTRGLQPDDAEGIAAALALPGPVVCDVDCGTDCTYEPRIFGWNTPIEDMYPYLPRDEFRANLSIEPWPGWETPAMPGGAR